METKLADTMDISQSSGHVKSSIVKYCLKHISRPKSRSLVHISFRKSDINNFF